MRTPDLKLEQVFLNESTGKDIPELVQSMDAIQKSNEEILRAYPAAEMKEAVLAKMREAAGKAGNENRRVLNFRILSYAAAVCCVLFVSFVAVRTELFTTGSGVTFENGERVKGGGQRLFIYKKIGDTPVPLPAKAKLSVNDIVQISYIAGGDAFGAILSVDGNGVVTQHFPDSGDYTARLSNEGEASLDFSYKLDNAPKFERFIFISGTEKVTLVEYKKALVRAAGADKSGMFDITSGLPPKAHVTDILLLK